MEINDELIVNFRKVNYTKNLSIVTNATPAAYVGGKHCR